jgi:ferredoxin
LCTSSASSAHMFSVALSRGKRFAAEAGLSVLDAAAGAGILLPYSCKTGRCGACKCRLIAGHTGKLRDENGLSEEEVAAGWMLSCARSAESDLILEADELDGTTLPRARTLPCRVHSLQLLATDVLRVELRLPRTLGSFPDSTSRSLASVGSVGATPSRTPMRRLTSSSFTFAPSLGVQ